MVKKKKKIQKKAKRRHKPESTMETMIRVQKMNGTYNTTLGAVARQVMREAGFK